MQIRVQVSCLAFRDNKLAFIKRLNPQSSNYNKFIPPGGHVELHETLEEACRREMQEETGLSVVNLKMKGVVSFIAHTSSYHSVCFFFVSNSVEGELQNNEPEKVQPCWIDMKDIESHNAIPEYHKAFISRMLFKDEFMNARVEWCLPDNHIEWKIENITPINI
ncbi:NUDIX domain-containing protein [Brevibacillus panacihumi]|nr:NUDIX hydrolase [Brevibacillus panacihumi]